MREVLEQLRRQAVDQIGQAGDLAALEQARVGLLGRKSELAAIMKRMGGMDPEQRKEVGQLANQLRDDLEALLEQKREAFSADALNAQLAEEKIDVTMPGVHPGAGRRHPLMLVLDELKEIFVGMGYEIKDGPEVEYDKYNFEMLNIPPDHPARDTQDTFYVTDSILLRTQTSPMQIRTMLSQKPPIRVIVPGRVYRSDDVDATHSPIFNQIEGLVVDQGIRLGDLKATLQILAARLYGDDVVLRFRPSHFPFTEPSIEVDMRCFSCHGEGCPLCKQAGWIEILGGGMVHPKVLAGCGIDPDIYSGWAFGIGLERLTMRKYQIDDLRLFYENDLRFLQQFN